MVKSIKLVSILYLIVAVFFFVWSIIMFILSKNINMSSSAMSASAIRGIFIGVLYLIVGIGLWKLKKWGKISAIILSGFVIIVSLYALMIIFHWAILSLLVLNIIFLVCLFFIHKKKN